MPVALRTPRLLLREWRDGDAEPFAVMSADAGLTEFLMPPDEAWVTRARAYWIGTGSANLSSSFPGWPRSSVSSVWATPIRRCRPRLRSKPHGGSPGRIGDSYALEAARAAIDDGLGRLGFKEIIAITVVGNQRSRRVMERLGMTRDPAEDFDFDHPWIPPGHKLRRHVLHRIRR